MKNKKPTTSIRQTVTSSAAKTGKAASVTKNPTKTPAKATAKTAATQAPAAKTATTSQGRVAFQTRAPKYSSQDVATRAYFISIERGGSPDENWGQAEAEFKAGLWV